MYEVLEPYPISQPALPDIICNALRADIAEGNYRPDEPMRIRTLAQRFGVSTMPVREALRRLEAEGLVEFDKNRRIMLRTLTPERADELFDIRAALEPLAMRRAVPNLARDADALGDLRALIDEMDASVDSDAWRTLNERFHKRIYAAAGTPRLEAIIHSAWAGTEAYIRRYSRSRENIAKAQHQHREMVKLIERGDAAKAASVLREQITYSRKVVKRSVFGDDAEAPARS